VFNNSPLAKLFFAQTFTPAVFTYLGKMSMEIITGAQYLLLFISRESNDTAGPGPIHGPIARTQHFGLQHPHLLRAYSTDANALELISSKQWEMIYIDGNHEYEVVRKDWEACSRNLAPGGIVVLDDSGLSTNFVPPIFATNGHPGPSRIAQQIDRKQFREILQVGHNRAFQRLA